MAQPPRYERGESFIEYATDHPAAPFPPANLESELDAIQETTDGVLDNLALIQRDDGKIANQAVHPDSFSAASLALMASEWEPRGLWLTATAYSVGDLVEQGGSAFVCSVAHTSGTFNTDHVAGKWIGLSGAAFSAFVQTLLDDPDAATFLGTLGFSAYMQSLIAVANVGALRSALAVYSATQVDSADAAVMAAAVLAFLPKSLVNAAGDILIGTADDTPGRLPVGAAGAVLMSDPNAATKLRYAGPFRNYIAGLIVSNNVTDANNDVDIAPGCAMDSTNADLIELSAVLTKRLDAPWAVGSGNGGLDAGSKANSSWYYIWGIKRADTGVVDGLLSLSLTAPTMPADYTLRTGKPLGAVLTNGSGNIRAFSSLALSGGGVRVSWATPILDVNVADQGNARVLRDLSVPNLICLTHIRFVASASGGFTVSIDDPAVADAEPSATASPLADLREPSASGALAASKSVITDASGRVASRSSVASTTLRIETMGFELSRTE